MSSSDPFQAIAHRHTHAQDCELEVQQRKQDAQYKEFLATGGKEHEFPLSLDLWWCTCGVDCSKCHKRKDQCTCSKDGKRTVIAKQLLDGTFQGVPLTYPSSSLRRDLPFDMPFLGARPPSKTDEGCV